jgi:predicted ABC-type ATPase
VLKAASYQIHLAYLWLAGPELAVARVRERVRQGGHSVPETTVRRRYFSGLRNLFNVYMPLVDDWFIYDNSHTNLEKIASCAQGQTHIQNSHVFKAIERLVKP